VNYLPYFFILIHIASQQCVCIFFLWEKNWSSFRIFSRISRCFLVPRCSRKKYISTIFFCKFPTATVQLYKKNYIWKNYHIAQKYVSIYEWIFVCFAQELYIDTASESSKVLMLWLTSYQFTLCHWNVPCWWNELYRKIIMYTHMPVHKRQIFFTRSLIRNIKFCFLFIFTLSRRI
jgi:hypothetical protein